MSPARVLLADKDELVRYNLARIFEEHGFEIAAASSLPDALNAVTPAQYDILLSDLYPPAPGDALTVVRAMRHANPRAVALQLNPATETDSAILLQARESTVKSGDPLSLIEAIRQGLAELISPGQEAMTEDA